MLLGYVMANKMAEVEGKGSDSSIIKIIIITFTTYCVTHSSVQYYTNFDRIKQLRTSDD